MDFFGNSRTANYLAPLEHKRLQACLRQVAGGNQSIMTSADDDDVVVRHLSIGVSRRFTRINADQIEKKAGYLAEKHLIGFF